MKSFLVALLAGGSLLIVSGTSIAQESEAAKWVKQCVADSAGMAATEQVKIMYCTCMVGKMSDNETRTVTQWEQANPAAAAECAKLAGWK